MRRHITDARSSGSASTLQQRALLGKSSKGGGEFTIEYYVKMLSDRLREVPRIGLYLATNNRWLDLYSDAAPRCSSRVGSLGNLRSLLL